jgi:hypothetical protein
MSREDIGRISRRFPKGFLGGISVESSSCLKVWGWEGRLDKRRATYYKYWLVDIICANRGTSLCCRSRLRDSTVAILAAGPAPANRHPLALPLDLVLNKYIRWLRVFRSTTVRAFASLMCLSFMFVRLSRAQ